MAAPWRDDEFGATRPGVDPESVIRRRRAERPWLRRRRLERKLHDGASLRISALSLRLGLLGQAPVEAALPERIGELQDELHAVLQELRAVAGEIYPSLLDEAGLEPALRELAVQRELRCTVTSVGERFGTAPEGAAYYALAECLTPGLPGHVRVWLGREGEDLVARIGGGSLEHVEFMLDQVRPLGGTIEVDPAGTITLRIPCG
jgi:hypothetical protein